MKISEILASPYTYAIIISMAAFIAAFASQQVVDQTKNNTAKLEETKQAIIDNLSKTVEAKEEVIGMLTGGDSYPSILFNEQGFLFACNGKFGIPNLGKGVKSPLGCILNKPEDLEKAFEKENTNLSLASTTLYMGSILYV